MTTALRITTWPANFNPFNRGWDEASRPISVIAHKAFSMTVDEVTNSLSLERWYTQWEAREVPKPLTQAVTVAVGLYFVVSHVILLSISLIAATAFSYIALQNYQRNTLPKLYCPQDYIPEAPVSPEVEILVSEVGYSLSNPPAVRPINLNHCLLIQDTTAYGVKRKAIILGDAEAQFFENAVRNNGASEIEGRRLAICRIDNAQHTIAHTLDHDEDMPAFQRSLVAVRELRANWIRNLPAPSPASPAWLRRISFMPRLFGSP